MHIRCAKESRVNKKFQKMYFLGKVYSKHMHFIFLFFFLNLKSILENETNVLVFCLVSEILCLINMGILLHEKYLTRL